MHIIKRMAAMLLIMSLTLTGAFFLIGMIPSVDLVIGAAPDNTHIQRNELLDHPARLKLLREKLDGQIRSSGAEVSLCLHDFDTGTRIENNGRVPIYPASMIKTLLLLATLEQVETGKLSLQEVHVLSEADKFAGETPVTGSGALQSAEPGTRLTVDELLSLMVTISDNVATNILFERVGAELVNAKAGRLGLHDTAFTRKMYEVDSPLPSNVSTACDLTEMLVALEQRKAVGSGLSEKGIALMRETVDKARIGRYTGHKATLANKIGTVSRIVGDMALLYFPHRPPLALTVAVLDPEDQEEAARVIGRLAELIVDHLAPAGG